MAHAKENPRKSEAHSALQMALAAIMDDRMMNAPATVMDNPRERLRDPAYFALHLQAAAAIREVGQLGWYDSQFLRRVEVARRYLAKVRPDALADFLDALAILTPIGGRREVLVEDIFDATTREEIVAIARAAEPERNERQAGENAAFGRDVIWNVPAFLSLQERVRPLVEELTGRPLVSSYNFLSRYGANGRCDLHMDAPEAMYTFDYCIEQDAVWPIYVSRVLDWIGGEAQVPYEPQRIIEDAGLEFREHRLRPNQALLFNGSSQWHHRYPKVAGGFCTLLFFHYYPEGCQNLVTPHRWAAFFGIPELAPLCDLFGDPVRDGIG